MVTNQQVENYAKRITQLEVLIAEKDTELANIAGKMLGGCKGLKNENKTHTSAVATDARPMPF